MPRKRPALQRLIIVDGNSFPDRARAQYITSFESQYSSDHVLVNKSVSGQTWTDMISDMEKEIVPLLSKYREVIIIAHETRNEIKLNGTLPAAVKDLAVSYFQKIKEKVVETKTVCVLTSASYDNGSPSVLMTTIPDANTEILNEASGFIDFKPDLYNHDNFNDPTLSPPFDSDKVHYLDGNLGELVYTDFISTQVKTQFP